MGNPVYLIVILTVVFPLIVCEPSHSFIKFRSFTNSTPDVITAVSDKQLLWHAAWPSMLRFILFGNITVSLSLSCQVETLTNEYQLHNVTETFRRRGPWYPKWEKKQNLKENLPGFPKLSLRVGEAGKVVANITPKADGAVVDLFKIPPNVSLDYLEYFCTAANSRGIRTSNRVEIYDYRNQFLKGIRTIDEPQSPIEVSNSMSFSCLETPLQVDRFISIPYEWSVCNKVSSAGISATQCKSVLSISPHWRVQILSNGTLYWSYVPLAVAKKLKGKTLKCSIGGQTMSVFSRPLNFISNNKIKKELRLSPPQESLFLFDSPTTDVQIPVFIEGDGRGTNLQWTNNQQPLAEMKSKPGRGKCLLSDRKRGIPRCLGSFNSDDVYCVKVCNSAKSSSAEGCYDVSTSCGYPMAENSMEKLILTMDGDDATVTCRFKRPELVSTTLTIDGIIIYLYSQMTIATAVEKINQNSKSVRAPIRASITIGQPQEGKILSYKVYQMRSRDPHHQNLSSAHYIECVGKRDSYTIHHPVIFQVVPRPIMEENGTPASFDECKHKNFRERTYKCYVQNKKTIEDCGAKLVIMWMLGNTTVARLHPDIRKLFSDNGHELRVTSGPKDVVECVNRFGTVSCVIELRYPDAAVTGPGRNRTIYSSKEDINLAKVLVTKIKLFPMEPCKCRNVCNCSSSEGCRLKEVNVEGKVSYSVPYQIATGILVLVCLGLLCLFFIYFCKKCSRVKTLRTLSAQPRQDGMEYSENSIDVILELIQEDFRQGNIANRDDYAHIFHNHRDHQHTV